MLPPIRAPAVAVTVAALRVASDAVASMQSCSTKSSTSCCMLSALPADGASTAGVGACISVASVTLTGLALAAFQNSLTFSPLSTA